MTWIHDVKISPSSNRFAYARVVGQCDDDRETAEHFIASIYRDRYGAQLHQFLPHILTYHDRTGGIAAAVGLRLASDDPLFVEQYLEVPAEDAIARRLCVPTPHRSSIAEVGNFAAVTPGSARELIVQLTSVLHRHQADWVVFAATKQLRNAFARLHLEPVPLAVARHDMLERSQTQWGSYYETSPIVMCGSVGIGHRHLGRSHAAASEPTRAACP